MTASHINGFYSLVLSFYPNRIGSYASGACYALVTPDGNALKSAGMMPPEDFLVFGEAIFTFYIRPVLRHNLVILTMNCPVHNLE